MEDAGTHFPLLESQDGLEREADERVGKEAEQYHAGDGTGQHER